MLYSLEDIRAEQRIVRPERNEIIARSKNRPIGDFTAQELRELTEAQTIWVPHGDHTWLLYPSIAPSRAFAHHFSRTFRSTGEPECVHGLGSADIGYNIARLSGVPPEILVFVLYFHDLLENNRRDTSLTAERIFRAAWKGDPLLISAGMDLLEKVTDTPGLHKKKRHEEQIRRANEDETGFVAVVRIIDKLNAGYQDYYNLLAGTLPFGGDWTKFKEYLESRKSIVERIKIPLKSVDILKALYREVTTATRKEVALLQKKGLFLPSAPSGLSRKSRGLSALAR